jgi:adenine-specific DNA-methyltransferase
MKKIAFLSYQIKPQEIDATKQDFEELSLDNQKKLLITTLEKNHLYVSFYDIDDETYKIKENDKKLNHQFYNSN